MGTGRSAGKLSTKANLCSRHTPTNLHSRRCPASPPAAVGQGGAAPESGNGPAPRCARLSEATRSPRDLLWESPALSTTGLQSCCLRSLCSAPSITRIPNSATGDKAEALVAARHCGPAVPPVARARESTAGRRAGGACPLGLTGVINQRPQGACLGSGLKPPGVGLQGGPEGPGGHPSRGKGAAQQSHPAPKGAIDP